MAILQAVLLARLAFLLAHALRTQRLSVALATALRAFCIARAAVLADPHVQ